MREKDNFSEYYPVALMFGGRGYERDISKCSAKTLYRLLRSLDIDTLCVFITPDGDFSALVCGECAPCESGTGVPAYPVRLGGKSGFLIGNRVISVGCVIPALHGDFGEDGRVAGALCCAGINFVGADVLGGALSQDKAVAKLIARSEGIPTVPFVIYEQGHAGAPCGRLHAYSLEDALALCERELGYEIFVKPASLGSSIGCVAVKQRDELIPAITHASRYDKRVIIEKYIDTEQELEVAYLGGEPEILAGPASVRAQGFYDYEKKYLGKAGTVVSPTSDIDGTLKARVLEYSATLVRLLQMRSLARVDFLLSRDGQLYFNEINAFPGFTDASLYLRLVRGAGVDDRELMRRLLNTGEPI